ncbi:MAG: fibronectin type III domain-containing protein [Bacteroidota bacterium]
MRHFSFLITVFLLINQFSIQAANKVTVASGNWNNTAVWGGAVPLAGDNISISAGHTVTVNVNPPSVVNVTVNGTLSFDATGTGRSMTVTGTLTISNTGILNCVAPGSATTHTLNYNGTALTNNGTINMVNGTNVCNVIVGGGVAQIISGSGTTSFNKFRLHNTGGKFSITYGAGAFTSALANVTSCRTSFSVADSLTVTRGLLLMNGLDNSTLTHTVGNLRMGSGSSTMTSSINITAGSVTIDVNTAIIMNDAANAAETFTVNGIFQSPNMTQNNSAIAMAFLGPNSNGGANNKTICNFNGDVNIPDLLGIVGNTRLYTGIDPKRPQLNFSGNVYLQYLKSHTIDIPLTSQDIIIKTFFFGLFDSIGAHPQITLNGGTEASPKTWNVPFNVFDAPIQNSNPPIGSPIVAQISESAADWVVNGVREIISGSSMAIHSNDTLKLNGELIVDSGGEVAGSETETDSTGFVATAGPLLLFGSNGIANVLNAALGSGLLTEAASNVAFKNRTADFNFDLNAISNSGKIIYSAGTAQSITTRTYNKLFFTGAGTKSNLGSVTVNDSLSSSSALSLSTFNITAKKNVVLNAGVGGSGGIIFNGNANQNAGGTSANWGNITLNNPSGVTLVTDLNTNGVVIFTNGKLNTSSGAKLVLSSSGNHAGSSATSFVNGPMSKVTASTSAFLLPVGKGTTYRPIEVKPQAGNSTTWNAEYFGNSYSNTSSLQAPIISVSNAEYFILDRSGVSPANATVKLNWGAGSGFADTLGLRVARWNGAAWENAGVSACTGNAAAGTITSNVVSSFSPFTFGRVAINTVTLGSIPGLSFCKGTVISIPFTSTGTYNNGNTYAVQLSDAAGSFAAPISIGALASIANSGNISATIPFTVLDGAGYRMRIISSDPAVTSADNGSNISITSPPVVTLAINPGNSVCASGTVTISCVPTGISPFTFIWSTGAITSSIVVGAGTYSATVTDANGCVGSASTVITQSPCGAPTNDTATSITGTSAKISWVGNSCAVKYRIQYRVLGATAWSTTAVTAPTLFKTLTNLLSLTTYEYHISSDCNTNGSIASAYTAIKTFTTPCNCAKPTNISASGITQTSTTLNWTGNTCAIKYRLQYRKQGVTAWTTTLITGPTVTKTLVNLTANTTYEFHLRSDCSATGSVNSGFTTIQTFTTALRIEDIAANISGYDLTIFPNPSDGKFALHINASVEGNAELKITNILGQQILNSTVTLKNGENIFNYSLENVSAGIYMVEILSAQGIVTKKLRISNQ